MVSQKTLNFDFFDFIFLFGTTFLSLSKLIPGLTATKKALTYSYKTAGSGFSSKLTAEQVLQVSSECFFLQLLMELFNPAGFLDGLGVFFCSFMMIFFFFVFGNNLGLVFNSR